MAIPGWVKFAKVGDKVVCTEEGAAFFKQFCPYGVATIPEANRVYTVSAIYLFDDGVVGFCVAEIERPRIAARHRIANVWWKASYFRPVSQRPTDISVFTAMLNRHPSPTAAKGSQARPAFVSSPARGEVRARRKAVA